MNTTTLQRTTHDAPAGALRFDPAAVREHLTRLHEGRPFEIRALRRRKGSVYAGYFDNVEAAVQAIGQLLSPGRVGDAKGWYTTLNPINPERLGRAHNRLDESPSATTADHDVPGYRRLLLDVDPERPTDTSSTDAQLTLALATRDAVRAYLAEQEGWGDPLYAAMTGNGGALVYTTESLPNDPATTALFKRCLNALQQRFGTPAVKIDESVFNPARITKLMGTVARKGDSTPRQPHRMAVAEYPPTPGTVTHAQLERLAAGYEPPAPAHPVNGRTPAAGDAPRRTWMIEDVLARSGVDYHVKPRAYGTVYQLDRCLTSEAHDDGAVIIEHPGGALAYRCQHNTCAGKQWADAKQALTFPERNEDFSRFSRTLVAAEKRPPNGASGGSAHLGVASDPPFSSFSSFSSGGSSTESLAEAFAEVPELARDERPSAEALVAAEVTREVWLEPYIRAAEERYPMTPRALHEAAGITALLTADARRHYVQAGHKRLYASAYLMFVAESGVAKTDGLNFMRDVLRDAGLVNLLLPAAFTAPALVDFLSLHLPEKVKLQGGGLLQDWLRQRAHGGVGSIVRDELVSVLDDCTKDYNGGLLPLLLKMSGAPDWVDDELTLSRGRTGLERVGINILGATTPIALEKHAAKAEHWHNGLFSRFALVAPHGPIRETFWQRGKAALAQLPGDVVAGLRQVYVSAPPPSLVLEYEPAPIKAKGKGKAAGGDPPPGDADEPETPEQRIVGVSQKGYAPQEVPIDGDAWDAWERYFYALRRMRRMRPNRLKSTYSRLHDHAIRLALVLAVADWAIVGRHAGEPAPTIRLGHWAAAQELTEAWRRDAHQILSEAIIGESTEARQAAGIRLVGHLERVKREGGEIRVKRGDVLRSLHLTTEELDAAIAASTGAVCGFEAATAGRPAQYVALAEHAPEEGRATKATKATKVGSVTPSQVTAPPNGAFHGENGDATKARLKATKAPDVQHDPGAAKANGHARVLPDGDNDGDDDWGTLSAENGGDATGTAAVGGVAVAVCTAPGAGAEVMEWRA